MSDSEKINTIPESQHDAHAMTHSPEEIRKHVRFYIGVFGALVVLTILTVAVSRVHIGPPDSHVPNIVVGLLIAAAKATLVGAFFMHLSSEKKMIYRIIIIATAFVIGLFFLSLLGFFDPISIKH